MDKTEPRNRLIAFYTLLAVATLAMLKPAFDAYYDQMFETARADRLATYDDMAELRETERGWRQRLEGGRMSIDDAMEQLGQRGRTAMPQIAPRAEAEMNMDPLRGWSHMPEGAGLPAPEPEPEAGEDPEALMDTVLEGGEAPPEAEGEAGAADPGAGDPGAGDPGAGDPAAGVRAAPGQDPGTEAPGGARGAGQPGAGGAVPPPVVREARRRRPGAGGQPAPDEDEGATE